MILLTYKSDLIKEESVIDYITEFCEDLKAKDIIAEYSIGYDCIYIDIHDTTYQRVFQLGSLINAKISTTLIDKTLSK